MAVLDSEFAATRDAAIPRSCPRWSAARCRRSRHIATNMAIVQQPRIDLRLHMLFWELADRWGTVRQDGVHVPLYLTHSMLVGPRGRAAADRDQGAGRAGGSARPSCGPGATGCCRASRRTSWTRSDRCRSPTPLSLVSLRSTSVGPGAPSGQGTWTEGVLSFARFGQRRRTTRSPPGGSALPQGRGPLRRRPAAAGALHVTFVRSTWRTPRSPGSTPRRPRPPARRCSPPPTSTWPSIPRRRSFGSTRGCSARCSPRETVRFVGDIVAVVLAESREASVDAAELVEVDYEPLPAVTDLEEAVRDEILLFPDVGTNICLAARPLEPDPGLFASARSSSGPGRQPAAGGMPDRAARDAARWARTGG